MSEVPIFVLSHARTGSTLMRYVLDAHPEVCCPPEVALGRLCHALHYTLGLTMPHGEDAERVSEAVRGQVDAIMRSYCEAKGKRRWCDKSTNNVEHLPILAKTFPDAQFICLHRNCLDVVHSLLELFRFGYPGRFGELVAGSPGNVVEAMIDSWLEATTNVLAFEASCPASCFRLKYEDFVSDPATVAARMFAFLGLEFSPLILNGLFSSPHDPGPGDLKIQFTSTILSNRIGRGATVPRAQISNERLDRINGLHQTLGYPPVVREGGPDIEHVLRTATHSWRSRPQQRWG